MKRLLFFIGIFVALNSYSQVSFENGYFISNSGKKTVCLIKNVDWYKNPTNFDYKLSESDQVKTAGIDSVTEFSINNISKYIRDKVKFDISGDDVNSLSKDGNPIYGEKVLFLKVLVEGKANLYRYTGERLSLFFYKVDNMKIEQLVYKRYKTPDGSVRENHMFKSQLMNDVNCASFDRNNFQKLEYSQKSLTNFFITYNNCKGVEVSNYTDKPTRDNFRLTFRPRVSNSSLSVDYSETDTKDVDFGNKIGVGFGVEAEYILPFRNNKWSLTAESTYRSYKSEKSYRISNYDATAEVVYKSLELPLGVRHYFFLGNNSEIFINANCIIDINLDSSLDYNYFYNDIMFDSESFEFVSLMNFALGLGYKFKDNYSFELQYQTNRNVMKDRIYWSTDYKTVSLIFGYTFDFKK